MLVPAPTELFFKGRSGDPRLGEWVEVCQDLPQNDGRRLLVALYGCPDDTGIVINKGRAGAKAGPDSIRKHLYKMALPMDFELEKYIRFVDLGNIVVGNSIEETHRNAQSIAQIVSKSGAVLIALGGGHDFAAPNILGWATGLPAREKKGFLNIDPHLDVRPLENGLPHSGSPFRQILSSKLVEAKCCVAFGTRANRNAREHYLYARNEKLKVCTMDGLLESNRAVSEVFKKELKLLAAKNRHLALTIDLDCCSDGEGTSAAPVVGFSGNELYSMAAIAGRERKISYLEIAEASPPLDPAERTSRVGAEIIFSFLYSRAKSLKKS